MNNFRMFGPGFTSIQNDNGCIVWQKFKSKRRCPRAKIKGKDFTITRLVLTTKIGREILPGYYACHTCDNPSCINSDHLSEGTPADYCMVVDPGTDVDVCPWWEKIARFKVR